MDQHHFRPFHFSKPLECGVDHVDGLFVRDLLVLAERREIGKIIIEFIPTCAKFADGPFFCVELDQLDHVTFLAMQSIFQEN